MYPFTDDEKNEIKKQVVIAGLSAVIGALA